jgi:formamidopyrimidine-DNA glycosylase
MTIARRSEPRYLCAEEHANMPELPEVETVRRGLAPVMEHARFRKVIAHRGDLRWPLPKDFVARLTGQTVKRLGRRAKYLLAELASGEVLMMHLGMSGSFRVTQRRREEIPGDFHYQRGNDAAHDHVIFHMSSGAVISFNDPRRFGMMKLVPKRDLEAEPLLKALGPEPLASAFNAERLARLCRGKKTSLKAALSDQRIAAGLGNIYVCEALHRARLSPKRRAGSIAVQSGVATQRAQALVEAIKAVLGEAIAAGGSSLRDHRRTDGGLGEFQHNFRVYDQEGKRCPRRGCGGTIKRIVQGGRSTYYCPVCQK